MSGDYLLKYTLQRHRENVDDSLQQAEAMWQSILKKAFEGKL